MLDFIKVTIFLLIISQLFSTAQADWHDYIPNKVNVEKAQRWALAHSSRENRLFLFSNLPNFFTVDYLCQLREGERKTALIPGDDFRVQGESAELECKGFFKATLLKDSAGSLAEVEGEPQFTLTRGEAELGQLGKKAVFHFSGYDVKVLSSDPAVRFNLLQSEQSSVFFCSRGLAELEVNVNPGPEANQSFFGAGNCRLTVSGNSFQKKRYIFSEEIVHPADLGISSDLLPKIPREQIEKKFAGKSLAHNEEAHVFAFLEPSADPKAPVIMRVTRSHPAPANCSLYSQAGQAALVQAYQFKLNMEYVAAIKLHPDYRKFRLSLVCTSASGITVSNRFGDASQPAGPK